MNQFNLLIIIIIACEYKMYRLQTKSYSNMHLTGIYTSIIAYFWKDDQVRWINTIHLIESSYHMNIWCIHSNQIQNYIFKDVFFFGHIYNTQRWSCQMDQYNRFTIMNIPYAYMVHRCQTSPHTNIHFD